MTTPLSRRCALTTAVVATLSFLMLRSGSASSLNGIDSGIRALEQKSGGRLGVGILDTVSGQLAGSRLDEHFAMCSTFKLLAIAFTLSRVDRGEEDLDRRVFYGERDLVMPHKATKPHLSDGMTVKQLCEAAAVVSDSTAANLLLASFGGPTALDAYLRALGDDVTNLDNNEPSLNIVKSGERHDTTTPRAMVATMRKILLGSTLSPGSRARLIDWLSMSKDAATRRLRAGLPEGWRIANKPGTWEGVSTNDVGVIFPPGRKPIVIAAFLSEAPSSIATQEAVLAALARTMSEIVQASAAATNR